MSQGFDHVVHKRDKKTGKISSTSPYSLECHKDLKFYRRDGKCFDPSGKEIPDPKVVGELPKAGENFTRSQVAQSK